MKTDTNTARPALSPLELALFQQQWKAEGRYKAFVFATQCKGDISRLEAELADRQELVDSLLASNPRGPMSPGASPRIYEDAYIAGLREAITIVLKYVGADRM